MSEEKKKDIQADNEMLDAINKQILNIIQTDFPIAPRPYAVIAEAVGTTEEDAFNRVQELKSSKIIRRLGANFQSKKLGFRSTLCAAKVPAEKMDEFLATVNAERGVTHNYIRKHNYNVWFTLIAPSWDAVCSTLDGITEKTGIAILNLPATKLYKIRVDFAM